MGAFILAGLVAIGTVLLCGLMLFASGMASAPSASNQFPVTSTFWTGMVIAALIAASHWMPRIGW